MRATERLDAGRVEKPWRRWELQLRFGGGERAGDVTARLDGAVFGAGRSRLGPLDLELALGRAGRARRAQRQRQDDARRGAARPAAAQRRHALDRPRRADRQLDQARAGFDGAAR